MATMRSPEGRSLITRRAGLGLAALALAGWFGLGVPGRPALAQAKPALVFAAASLKNALDEIAAQYERETGKKVTISYGASSALAKQVEAAAPADLFISADLDWMDYLQTRNLIKTDTRGNMLGNRIHPHPTWAGKAATFFQVLTVLTGLLSRFFQGQLALRPMLWLAAGFTIISGLQYLVQGMRFLNASTGVEREDSPEDALYR